MKSGRPYDSSPTSCITLSASPSCENNMNFFWIRKRYDVNENKQKDKKENARKIKSILKIFRYATIKDKNIFFLSLLASVAMNLIPPLTTWILLTPVLDLFIKMEAHENPHNLTKAELASKIFNIGYKYFITTAANFIFSCTQVMCSETVSRSIMAKIKTAYLKKMLLIEMNWHDKSQEKFISTLSHDLRKMTYLLDTKIASAIGLGASFLFGCGAGFIVSWKVALLAFVLMLFTIVAIYFIIQLSKNKRTLQQQYNEKLSKIASEVVGNARTVAAYGGEYQEAERLLTRCIISMIHMIHDPCIISKIHLVNNLYKNTIKMAYKNELKRAIIISIAKGFNYFQLCICYMAAYYFSVRLFLLDDFEPANIAMILSAQITFIYRSAYTLNTFSDIIMATDSAHRVMHFLEIKTQYEESVEKGIVTDNFEANVSFRNAHFYYPSNLQNKVLHDLTLDIETGKVTAVVGTSGAGKSTIVDLALRLYDINAGQILIGGIDIKKFNLNWLRNQISVVGQEPMMFDISIEENIRFGNTTATMDEIIDAAKMSHAHGFIEKLPLGYHSIIGEGGFKLSGGQKQRIAIARAIVRKPKLLLLDEATSALDSHSEVTVQKALANAMRGRTTLIIAHRMSTVRNADVIYAIKNGCVVENGTHWELMELKGYYFSLVKNEEQGGKKENTFASNKEYESKEDLIVEEKCFVGENNMEERESHISFKINKNSIKVIVICLLAISFTIIASGFLPAFYYVYSLFCESYTFPKDELHWIALRNVSIILGLGIVSFFSILLSDVMSIMATQIWLKKLRNKVFNKIAFMDISWFDRSGNSPTECLEVMINCPPVIESVAGSNAAQVIVFFLSLLISFGYSFFISLKVTLVNLPIVIIYIMINCVRLKSRTSAVKSASLTTKSTKVATEYVRNVKTIQLLNCQNHVINQYQDILMLSKKEDFESIIWYAVVYGLGKTLIRLSIGITFILEAYDLADRKIRGTLLISVMSVLSFASMSAGPAFILMSQYPQAKRAIMRLNRIAFTKTYFSNLKDQGSKPEISGNIIFQDVMFSYPTRDEVIVFNKLNLEIEAGKTVALIGDSGSGKSTIISLLERFYLPTKGKILIDGNEINNINVRYLRSQMGLVPQEPALFDMTIKENILYGSEGGIEMDKIIEAAKIANIHNFIMKLPQAYDTPVGERGSKLSGGQKQRIGITRAILRNPKILLLDESTSALDTESEKAVQEALEKASIGKTTVVITHRLSTIRKADKIIVIQSGKVTEEGNHEQLMEKKGYYFSLLNSSSQK